MFEFILEEHLSEREDRGDARPHHGLDVWRKSIKFVRKIYEITNNFPDDEKFGLVSQMRRAAVSISSNIAEGAARNTMNEFKNFLHMAQASNSELETQLLISADLNFVPKDEFEDSLSQLNDISKMLVGLQKSLEGSE